MNAAGWLRRAYAKGRQAVGFAPPESARSEGVVTTSGPTSGVVSRAAGLTRTVLVSAATIVAVTGVPSLGGCTAIVLTSADQCTVDGDCAFLGPDFKCGLDGVCAPPPGPTSCATDQDCTDSGLVDHTCDENGVCRPLKVECTTAQECIDTDGGQPAACVEGGCVSLLNEHCQIVVPEDAVGDDDTIFIGWMGPLAGDFESIGTPIQQAAQLALEEIDNFVNGLPGGDDGGRRKLAMIACHSLDDHLAVARHLVNDVKVPAIIGPAFSGITLDVTTEVSIPGGTLVISPSATSPAITDIDDDGLVWRTAPSDAVQAVPLGYLVSSLETVIRNELMLMASDDIKVAAASKGDAYGQGLIGALTGTVTFNGRDVTDNLAANAFLSVQYADPSTMAVDYTPIVQQIVAFTPHLVIPLGTNEGITAIMAGVESAWSTPPPRPRYLFPDGGRLDELLDATQTNADLRGRVKGTVPGKQGVNYQQFALRFESRFSKAPGTFTENAYDAAYLLAFAIVSGGDGKPTGAKIADGLKRMTGGQANITAGPNDINAGFNAVAGGGAIDFNGASGPLEFNVDTGEAESDIDIWCIDLDNQLDARFISSGEYYDAAMGTVIGTDSCPTN